jgi:DNA-binding transcriptional MerR regulator
VSYTRAQAARLAGCTTSQLDAWRRIGLVASASAPASYSFRDLVALRMVTSLLGQGVPTRRIRRAVDALLAAGDDLAALVLVGDGDTVLACRHDGQVLDALRDGQLALFVPVGRLARDVDAEVRTFAAERASFVDAISAPG